MKKPPPKTADKPRTRPRLAIDDRLDEIRIDQRSNLDEILALEKKGVRPIDLPEEPSLAGEAMRLLDRIDTAASAQPRSDSARLRDLYHTRAVIEQALVIGQQRQFQAHSDRCRQVLVDRADEWRELVYQTALAVLTLQKCNRAREAFISDVTYGSGRPNMVCTGFRLLGFENNNAGEVYEFLRAVVKAGIMTEKEIENV